MAIYVYFCETCETEKDVTHKMSDIETVEILCEKCNEPLRRKVGKGVKVFYRAGGFYSVDTHQYQTTTNKHGESIVEKTKKG